jgi:hypothetical protein
LVDKIRLTKGTGRAAIQPQNYLEGIEAVGRNPHKRRGRPMSNDATNLLSVDGYRGPGTYAEALLVQSHQKEAASRSAKFLNYGWSTNENVVILESLINPNTMEVLHYWLVTAPREGRVNRGE